MKKRIAIIAATLILTTVLSGCGESAGNSAATAEEVDYAAILEDIVTVQKFTEEPVNEADIDAIVMAGVNAPSAMNGQPWHFSVITNAETLETLSSSTGFGGAGPFPANFDPTKDMPEGMPEGMPERIPAKSFDAANKPSAKAGMGDAPLVIVVSCKAGSELDAGLATQNMSAEAQLLGYGTKIISSPKMTLNSEENLDILGVPDGMTVVCVLLVGKTSDEDYDAISGATARNPVDDVVTFIR